MVTILVWLPAASVARRYLMREQDDGLGRGALQKIVKIDRYHCVHMRIYIYMYTCRQATLVERNGVKGEGRRIIHTK